MNTFPHVSIIIPIRNESAYINKSLSSILAQDYPAHFLEIIFSDGNSVDDTREKISEMCQKFPDRQIKVVDNPSLYMPNGFNLGLSQSTGEIIIMMGGHAELSQDYVSQCVKLLIDRTVACVGGPMDTVAEGIISQCIAIAMGSVFGVGNVTFRIHANKVIEVDTVVFAAYRRKVFEEIGLLDEEMIRNQDDEFNYRLREFGGRILYSPKIRSRYYSRSNFSSLWKQYFEYGYWKVRVLQKHPRQMSLRQFVPPVFVTTLIVSALFAISSIPYPSSIMLFLSSIIPLLYFISNLCASIWTASKRGWHFILLLPIAFAILHLSYGLGFLVGLIKFWNRWGDKIGKVPGWSSETS